MSSNHVQWSDNDTADKWAISPWTKHLHIFDIPLYTVYIKTFQVWRVLQLRHPPQIPLAEPPRSHSCWEIPWHWWHWHMPDVAWTCKVVWTFHSSNLDHLAQLGLCQCFFIQVQSRVLVIDILTWNLDFQGHAFDCRHQHCILQPSIFRESYS